MSTTSAGSRPNPKEFLSGYADEVERAIEELQYERSAAPGESALHGKVSQTVKERAPYELSALT
jgi:hypothetical protein